MPEFHPLHPPLLTDASVQGIQAALNTLSNSINDILVRQAEKSVPTYRSRLISADQDVASLASSASNQVIELAVRDFASILLIAKGTYRDISANTTAEFQLRRGDASGTIVDQTTVVIRSNGSNNTEVPWVLSTIETSPARSYVVVVRPTGQTTSARVRRAQMIALGFY